MKDKFHGYKPSVVIRELKIRCNSEYEDKRMHCTNIKCSVEDGHIVVKPFEGDTLYGIEEIIEVAKFYGASTYCTVEDNKSVMYLF